MDLYDEFERAVEAAYRTNVDSPELLPMLLAQACVAVLPVAGASLSMTDELRVPLGANDAATALAERVQTSLGEGPCLAASAACRPMVFDEATTTANWPMFSDQVFHQTPYRSFASIPLGSPDLPRFGALDLYSTDPEALPWELVEAVDCQLADRVADSLFTAPTAVYRHGLSLPTWLNVEPVTNRMNVWVAVGMLMERAALTNPDALAMLRAYAFGHGIALEEVAAQMTERHLLVEAVLI